MSPLSLVCGWMIWALGILVLLVLPVFLPPRTETVMGFVARIWIYLGLGILTGASAVLLIKAALEM